MALTVPQLLLLAFICCSLQNIATGQSIDMTGIYHCDEAEDGRLLMHFRAYDRNGIANHMRPIDANENDINTCVSSGSIASNDPYVVDVTVDIATDTATDNQCGMVVGTLTGNIRTYTWRFRARRLVSGQDIGNKFTLIAECRSDDLTKTRVDTLVRIEVKLFNIDPVNEIDRITGNTIRTDADLKYTGYLYPEDETGDLQNAKGFYYYDCYSGTDVDVTENREKFIDANGCRIEGAAYAPTNEFRQTSAAGVRPITVEASVARAQLVNGQENIYCKCKQGYCLEEDDPNCIQRCGSTKRPGSTIDTDIEYTDHIIVKDEVVQSLFGVESVAPGSSLTIVTHGTDGDQIYLVAKFVPNGIGSDADFENAKGFFLYNCRWSVDDAVPNGNSVRFVDNNGCVESSDLSPAAEFEYNSDLSSSSVYVITSGLVTLRKQSEYRVYFKCFTGICLNDNNPFCQRRCGTTGSQANVRRLGYKGLFYGVSIIAGNEPPVALEVGDADLQTAGGMVGDEVNFGATIVPDTSTDPGLQNAAGAYLTNCYATVGDDPTRHFFIDDEGCRNESSPFATSQECMGNNDGIPPFVINCGTFVISEAGPTKHECEYGYCTTADHGSCMQRCNKTVAAPSDGTIIDTGRTVSSQFTAFDPTTTPTVPTTTERDRTAIESERLRAILIALAIVIPAAIMAGVAIGICCLIYKASMANKTLF